MERLTPLGQAALFDRIISPVTRESFLSEFWGRSFLHVAGQTGRFTHLLPWSELNSILERHRLEPPRLTLVRNDKPVDPSLFIGVSGSRSGLKPAGLMNCLAEGATLVLDYVDELAPAVGQLAEAFQEVLRSRTNVNLYAAWRTQKGFDLHWDAQDTVVLQLSGRKHWKVYRPTRLHPMKSDLEAPPTPTGDAFWDGVLEDGDMISMPRGWWHVALPLDEPSLHLTVTLEPATGVDLLRWFVDQLKHHHAGVRMNLPYPASLDERKRYVTRLRELIAESCDDDISERFLAEWDANIPLRPSIRLPHEPGESSQPITMGTHIRLATSRRVVFVGPPANGTVSFVAEGIRSECAADLVPALTQLSGVASRSVGELARLLAPDAIPRFIALLNFLAMRGVLQVEQPPG